MTYSKSEEIVTLIRAHKEYSKIPFHLHPGLVHYLLNRIKPGHFLTSVLQDQLSFAFAYGDPESIKGLKTLILFLHNIAPGNSYGSYEKVQRWIDPKRDHDPDNVFEIMKIELTR